MKGQMCKRCTTAARVHRAPKYDIFKYNKRENNKRFEQEMTSAGDSPWHEFPREAFWVSQPVAEPRKAGILLLARGLDIGSQRQGEPAFLWMGLFRGVMISKLGGNVHSVSIACFPTSRVPRSPPPSSFFECLSTYSLSVTRPWPSRFSICPNSWMFSLFLEVLHQTGVGLTCCVATTGFVFQ